MKQERRLKLRRWRRARRVRRRVQGTPDRPRLSVFRSDRHIYCQLIDDRAGHSLAQASTREGTIRESFPKSWSPSAAERVGAVVAERAKSLGIVKVAFDRGCYRFHGRVKALAEGARKAGLQL